MAHYAINLSDLIGLIPRNAHPLLNPYCLLIQPILAAEIVHCEGRRMDGGAVRVKSDLDPERWEAIYTLIRQGAGKMKPISRHQLRIYRSLTGHGGWRRI